MGDATIKKDPNDVPAMAGVSDDTSQNIRPVTVDPTSGALQVNLETAIDKTNDSITNYPAGCTCTVVDLATDADVVVTAAPALLLGVKVTVVMSAHAALLKDSATTVITLPASTAAGYEINCHGTTFATNITVESDNAATGTVLVFWRAL